MDRSSFGSALDGSDLGGNEVQAARMLSVSHRSEAVGIVTAKTARVSREAIAWGSDESVVQSRQGNRLRRQKPGASSSSASARFDSSFADFWLVASCVGPFAEADARYRVAPPWSNGWPERVGRKSRRSAEDGTARECWALRRSEQSRRLARSRRGLLFAWCRTRVSCASSYPLRGMTSARVFLTRDVRAGKQVRERRVRTAVPRSCGSALTERSGRQRPAGRRNGVRGRQLRAG